MPLKSLVILAMIGTGLGTLDSTWAQSGPEFFIQNGYLECGYPDSKQKTCESITKYEIPSDGTVQSMSEAVVTSHRPRVIISLPEQEEIEDGMLCSVLTLESYAGATFTVDGEAATQQQAQTYMNLILQTAEGIMGLQLCVKFVPAGEIMKTEVYLNGILDPRLSSSSKWVKPEEGYRLKD